MAQNITRLDFTLLKRSLTKHSSGLYLLPRPVQLEDIALITPDDLQRVIGLLKATFTHLMLDLSKGYSRVDMVALEMATHVLLVTQLDLPCLRNVVRLMMSFDDMDGLADKVKIVVNRVGLDNGQITLKKAQETIGREIFWQLPNDYRTMIEVRNNGVPLIEQAPGRPSRSRSWRWPRRFPAASAATKMPKAGQQGPVAEVLGQEQGQDLIGRHGGGLPRLPAGPGGLVRDLCRRPICTAGTRLSPRSPGQSLLTLCFPGATSFVRDGVRGSSCDEPSAMRTVPRP